MANDPFAQMQALLANVEAEEKEKDTQKAAEAVPEPEEVVAAEVDKPAGGLAPLGGAGLAPLGAPAGKLGPLGALPSLGGNLSPPKTVGEKTAEDKEADAKKEQENIQALKDLRAKAAEAEQEKIEKLKEVLAKEAGTETGAAKEKKEKKEKKLAEMAAKAEAQEAKEQAERNAKAKAAAEKAAKSQLEPELEPELKKDPPSLVEQMKEASVTEAPAKDEAAASHVSLKDRMKQTQEAQAVDKAVNPAVVEPTKPDPLPLGKLGPLKSLGELKPLGGLAPLKPFGGAVPLKSAPATEPEKEPFMEPAADGAFAGPDPMGKVCKWRFNEKDGWSYSKETKWLFNHLTAVYFDASAQRFCKYSVETGIINGTCEPDKKTGAIHFVAEVPTIKTDGPLTPVQEAPELETSEMTYVESPGGQSASGDLSDYLLPSDLPVTPSPAGKHGPLGNLKSLADDAVSEPEPEPEPAAVEKKEKKLAEMAAKAESQQAKEQAERDAKAKAKAVVDKAAAEQAEVARLAAEKAEQERLAAEKVAAEKAAERAAADKAEAERVAVERQAEADRIALEAHSEVVEGFLEESLEIVEPEPEPVSVVVSADFEDEIEMSTDQLEEELSMGVDELSASLGSDAKAKPVQFDDDSFAKPDDVEPLSEGSLRTEDDSTFDTADIAAELGFSPAPAPQSAPQPELQEIMQSAGRAKALPKMQTRKQARPILLDDPKATSSLRKGTSPITLDDPKRGSNMGGVAAARRMFEGGQAPASALAPKAHVMDGEMRRASSMKLAFTQLREDLTGDAVEELGAGDDTMEEEILEVEDESDEYGDDFDMSADDDDLIAMLSGGGSKPATKAAAPAPAAAKPSGGSGWAPPAAGGSASTSIGGGGGGGGGFQDDDLVEEFLEESLSTSFDFDSVKVKD